MDDSDYTSAESSGISDGEVGEDEKEDSDNESIASEEIHAGKQPATELPITGATNADHHHYHHHKKKKKNRKISIKNAFRRGRHANKALEDLRRLLEEAIQSNLLLTSDDHEIDPTEFSMWGIPLLPSKGHDCTDAILLKFLKSRDWKVPDAYEMLCRTLVWRRREKIDGILEEKMDTGTIADKMVFSDRTDREGRTLCYNLYGSLIDPDFYKAVFGTEKSKEEFIRWRIQILERIIRTKFKFQKPVTGELEGGRSGGDVVSLIEISDLKNLPANGMKNLVPMAKKMLSIFQEHYPDIIYRNAMQGFLNQHCSAGTRKKFVVERSNRITSRLLKYIEPQNIPIQYGGLKRDEDEFSLDDVRVFATIIKGGQQGKIEIPINEVHVTIVWDLMVVGSEVVCKGEFVPYDEGSYKVLIHKEGKVRETIRNSYYINEPGKIIITIKNSNLRRKRVFWRYRCKTTLPAYCYLCLVLDKSSDNRTLGADPRRDQRRPDL
ncbi:hypothetical protein V2J09_020169 [Rumex salicifolius]